jgi:hypothetical protein
MLSEVMDGILKIAVFSSAINPSRVFSMPHAREDAADIFERAYMNSS